MLCVIAALSVHEVLQPSCRHFSLKASNEDQQHSHAFYPYFYIPLRLNPHPHLVSLTFAAA
jgi:hypothetical protein